MGLKDFEGQEREVGSIWSRSYLGAGPVATARVTGQQLSRGTSSETHASQKRHKHEPKGHLGLPPEERQEYCKANYVAYP